MKIELFAICDAATDSGGKLNVLGIFDTLSIHQLPGVHARCAVVVKIRFERIERGEHRVKLNLVDADGKAVIPALEAQLPMNFPEHLSSASAQLILELNNLTFKSYGEFSIDLAIDNRQEASIPLFVRPAQRAGSTHN